MKVTKQTKSKKIGGRGKGKASPGKNPQKMKAGRNKKKTWKQLQHPDIDSFMDVMREDERLGGIRGKTDQQLFSIDRAADGAFGTLDRMDKKKRSGQIQYDSITNRRAAGAGDDDKEPLVNLDNLKCYRLLKPHTMVPDPLIKRNRVRRPGDKKPALMKEKDAQRQAKKLPIVDKSKPDYIDPWSAEVSKTVLDDNEWIVDSVRRHNLRPRIHPDAKKKNKTSELPAIAAPHPGYSYNPSYVDHQDLLRKAVTVEKDKIVKEQKLIKAIAATKCAGVDTDHILHISDTDEEEEEDDDKKMLKSKLDTPKARTRQKKRNEREEKEKQRLAQVKKSDNARLNEVYRIKSIQKQIIRKEKKQKAQLAKVIEKKIAHDRFGQKTLSKHKFQELSLNPMLSEDLGGTLVAMNVDHSLLIDRFNSLQQRNILEPRVKARPKRKLRLKKYQRSSAKMDWEKTGMWNGIKVL